LLGLIGEKEMAKDQRKQKKGSTGVGASPSKIKVGSCEDSH